jgi:ABC-type polysaccharide transport system permease subunit
MFNFNICAPALIYVAFSLTQIIIDTFKGLYNTALLKVFVMIIITILLNSLCQSGMGIISWLIVFIPFIFMSVIVAILLYVFGLNPTTGKINVTCSNCPEPKSGNLVFMATTDSNNNANNSKTYPSGTSDPQLT